MLAARVMPAARDPRSGVDAVKIDDRYVVGCGANCDSDCRLHGLLHHITYAIWRLHHMRYGGNIHTTFVIPVGRYRTNDFCVLNLRNRLNISRRRYIIYTTHLLGRDSLSRCRLPIAETSPYPRLDVAHGRARPASGPPGHLGG